MLRLVAQRSCMSQTAVSHGNNPKIDGLSGNRLDSLKQLDQEALNRSSQGGLRHGDMP